MQFAASGRRRASLRNPKSDSDPPARAQAVTPSARRRSHDADPGGSAARPRCLAGCGQARRADRNAAVDRQGFAAPADAGRPPVAVRPGRQPRTDSARMCCRRLQPRLGNCPLEFEQSVRAATKFPLLWRWLTNTATDPQAQQLLLSLLWRAVAVALLALLAERVAQYALRRPLAALDARAAREADSDRAHRASRRRHGCGLASPPRDMAAKNGRSGAARRGASGSRTRADRRLCRGRQFSARHQHWRGSGCAHRDPRFGECVRRLPCRDERFAGVHRQFDAGNEPVRPARRNRHGHRDLDAEDSWRRRLWLGSRQYREGARSRATRLLGDGEACRPDPASPSRRRDFALSPSRSLVHSRACRAQRLLVNPAQSICGRLALSRHFRQPRLVGHLGIQDT